MKELAIGNFILYLCSMRIVFLLSKWPVDGGIETVSRTLSNEFTARGHKVYVLYTDYFCPPNNSPFVDRRIVSRLIPRDGNECSKFDVAKKFIDNFVLDEKIDVLINQCFPTWSSYIFRDIKGKVKIIECLHMTLFYPSSYHRLRWTGFDLKMRLCGPIVYNYFQKKWRCESLMREFPYVDRFVFLSKSFVSEFLRFTKYNNVNGKVIWMNNPLSFQSNDYNESDIGKKSNYILCVARLSETEKRITYMLAVWKSIEEDRRFDDWIFDVVGDGPSASEYKQIAVKLGLRRVCFHGYQTPDLYYRRAKISLMTSVAEGLPMTLVESQYYGVVPLVMNTFSSVNDIIDNGVNGIIVPESKRKFLKALKYLMLHNKSRQLMACAAMKSSRRFTVGNIAKQWEDMIDNIKLN